MAKTCMNTRRVFYNEPGLPSRPCPEPATTYRNEWRFGDRSKGEPGIVKFRFYCCATCAAAIDENRREMAWEARVS
jgi:hypothetical protein